MGKFGVVYWDAGYLRRELKLMKLGCTVRKYGESPFRVAVIHGGPGAAGSAAPVARELSTQRGILEPLQTKDSIEGQIEELRIQLEDNADLPVTLIGASWGAMLSYLFAARYPQFVSKIIMVGSGMYEEKYAEGIMDTRLSRLSKAEREEALSIMNALSKPDVPNKDELMSRFGALIQSTDTFDHLETEGIGPETSRSALRLRFCRFDPDENGNNEVISDGEEIGCQYSIHEKVWADFVKLRKSGELLELGKLVHCPVIAIHGDYDPHPIEGLKASLSAVLQDIRFIVLKNCGHEPWLEKQARDQFFDILNEELGQI